MPHPIGTIGHVHLSKSNLTATITKFLIPSRPRSQHELADKWVSDLKAMTAEDTRLLEACMHEARVSEAVVVDYGPEYAKERGYDRYETLPQSVAVSRRLAVLYDPSSPSV